MATGIFRENTCDWETDFRKGLMKIKDEINRKSQNFNISKNLRNIFIDYVFSIQNKKS